MIVVLKVSLSYSQDLHIASVQEMNIWYNPALKTTKIPQVYTSFRNVNYPNIIAYSSKAIGIDLPLIPRNTDISDITSYANITAGINTNSSKDGSMASSTAMIALTYALPLNRNDTYISIGFNGCYNFNRIGTGIYNYYPSQFDKQGAIGSAIIADPYLSGYNFGYFTSSAGVAVYHNGEDNQWYAGVSTRNFNHPFTEWNRSSRLESSTGVQGGYSTAINDVGTIRGYANFNWHGAVSEHYFAVAYTRIIDDSASYKIGAGIGYRWEDAIVPSLELTLKRSRLNLYYDINFPGTLYNLYSRKSLTFSYSYTFK